MFFYFLFLLAKFSPNQYLKLVNKFSNLQQDEYKKNFIKENFRRCIYLYLENKIIYKCVYGEYTLQSITYEVKSEDLGMTRRYLDALIKKNIKNVPYIFNYFIEDTKFQIFTKEIKGMELSNYIIENITKLTIDEFKNILSIIEKTMREFLSMFKKDVPFINPFFIITSSNTIYLKNYYEGKITCTQNYEFAKVYWRNYMYNLTRLFISSLQAKTVDVEMSICV